MKIEIQSICEHCVVNDADRQCQFCGDYICDECASHARDVDYDVCKDCYSDSKNAQGEYYSNINSTNP